MTTTATGRSATSADVDRDIADGAEGAIEPLMSGDSSSRRHRLPHQYATHHDQFAGWLGGVGTSQFVGRLEVVAEAKFAPAAVRRADGKPRTKPTGRHALSNYTSRASWPCDGNLVRTVLVDDPDDQGKCVVTRAARTARGSPLSGWDRA
jgi:hypothetical protein